MKRVREQQESIGQTRFRSPQHRRLAASIGVSAQEHSIRSFLPHYLNCTPQSFLIALGTAAWRRAVLTQLAEWEITAKNSQAGFAESGCQCNEE